MPSYRRHPARDPQPGDGPGLLQRLGRGTTLAFVTTAAMGLALVALISSQGFSASLSTSSLGSGQLLDLNLGPTGQVGSAQRAVDTLADAPAPATGAGVTQLASVPAPDDPAAPPAAAGGGSAGGSDDSSSVGGSGAPLDDTGSPAPNGPGPSQQPPVDPGPAGPGTPAEQPPAGEEPPPAPTPGPGTPAGGGETPDEPSVPVEDGETPDGGTPGPPIPAEDDEDEDTGSPGPPAGVPGPPAGVPAETGPPADSPGNGHGNGKH